MGKALTLLQLRFNASSAFKNQQQQQLGGGRTNMLDKGISSIIITHVAGKTNTTNLNNTRSFPDPKWKEDFSAIVVPF